MRHWVEQHSEDLENLCLFLMFLPDNYVLCALTLGICVEYFLFCC